MQEKSMQLDIESIFMTSMTIKLVPGTRGKNLKQESKKF